MEKAAAEYTNTTDKQQWWLTHADDQLQFGAIGPGSTISSGIGGLEIFTSFLLWRARVIELGGTFD